MKWEEIMKRRYFDVYRMAPILRIVLDEWNNEKAQQGREYTMLEIRNETKDELLETMKNYAKKQEEEGHPEVRLSAIRDYDKAPSWKYDSIIIGHLSKKLEFTRNMPGGHRTTMIRGI